MATLTVDMRDVYPANHWAVRGEAPGFDTPDEDVYLDGRNIVLLAKASVFMARHRLSRVMLGPLAGNPFPDATPRFFDTMAQALSLGLAWPIVDRNAARVAAQGGRDQAGSRAGSAVRADAVVHAAGRRRALRPLQQVPRAARRISGGRSRRSDRVSDDAAAERGWQFSGLSE